MKIRIVYPSCLIVLFCAPAPVHASRTCYVNTRGTTCPPDALIVVEGVSNEASPVSGYDGEEKIL